MSDKQTSKLALIALLLFVPVPSLGASMGLWIAPGPFGKTVYALCKIWILALPVFWLLVVEKGRPSFSRPIRGGLGFGVASGAGIGLAILAAYFLAAPSIDSEPLRLLAGVNGFDRPATYLAFAAYFTFINALLEEYVWRWFVFTRCEKLMPRGAAIAAAALFFTLHHVLVLKAFFPWSITAAGAVGVFIGGAAWSWCYLRYRSIWPGYVSHAIVDAAILIVGWRLMFT